MVFTFLNFAPFRRQDDVDDKTLDLGAEDRRCTPRGDGVFCIRSGARELPLSFLLLLRILHGSAPVYYRKSWKNAKRRVI